MYVNKSTSKYHTYIQQMFFEHGKLFTEGTAVCIMQELYASKWGATSSAHAKYSVQVITAVGVTYDTRYELLSLVKNVLPF